MEGLELKPQFDELQKIFDRCIKHAYGVLRERLAMKTAGLDPEQMQEVERQEYNRIADELAELYLHHSGLSDLRFCYSEPAFLWEGGFFEALHADEKKKYLAFSAPSFDYSRYERDNTAYDTELPYFSAVVNVIVRERYAAYLRQRETSMSESTQKSASIAAPPIAETENPFDSILTDEQIAYLAAAVNDVKMFNVSLSADELKAIFACKPEAIVRSNNNRLVAFFFSGLSSRGLITPNWQSVIANHKLFLSKDTSRDKYINHTDYLTLISTPCLSGVNCVKVCYS